MQTLKKKRHLTPEQRYAIEMMLRIGKKQSEIAMAMDKSVISREIKEEKP